MGDIIEDMGGVLSFTLFKVEKGREKICKCNPPHYVIDQENRIVTCADCGATLDAFEALMVICNYTKEYEDYQEEAIKKINVYRELANEEARRRFRNKAFKEMDSKYKSDLFPHCPRCGEAFDPMEIRLWTNRKYCEQPESEDGQNEKTCDSYSE